MVRYCLAVCILALASQAVADSSDAPVDYNRQIRPILSNKCFACHGPDAAVRQAGLRLDERDAALAELDSGVRAIVPGDPDASALVERIFADDPDVAMPPADSNKQLTDEEKELLKRWVAQGAPFEPHWAFRRVERPALPEVKETEWVRNPIDRFVLAKLEAAGLKHAPEADRATLIRRLSLDLIGLPPTLEEIDAFIADTSADAYEKLVDRLLESPHFGERLALDWLDAARFADTNGYHVDNGRDMTPWRDWVINAFNENLPYDKFTIYQLAGDLLPGATLEQKIASGFNRNNMLNFEAGAIPAEYHVAYLVDRVNTTGTVWLGLTVGCAQCHDHKYDPITQKEFYQLYAFFNNVPEHGLDGIRGNAAPYVHVPPRPEQQAQLDVLDLARAKVEQDLREPDPSVDAGLPAWEEKMRSERPWDRWTVVEPEKISTLDKTEYERQPDGSLVASKESRAQRIELILDSPIDVITGVRVELFPDPELVNGGPGFSYDGNCVLTDLRFSMFDADAEEGKKWSNLQLASATADFSQADFHVEHAIDDITFTGWGIYPEMGKPHWAVFGLKEPFAAKGERISIALSFMPILPFHNPRRLRVSITGSSDPHGKFDPTSETIAALEIDPQQRTDEQRAAILRDYHLLATDKGKAARGVLDWIEESKSAIERDIPTVMVMQDMATPRETFMLERGQYDKKGEKVAAATPAFLPPLPSDRNADRLALAHWLVDRDQPLMPRVTVNRYWQMLFGAGIVTTAGDFGSQGEPPSHPELLDWLAAEFMEPSLGEGSTPWDVKRLLKLIVTSTTYRQASAVPASVVAADPTNRLLGRGARFRLQAELIRDHALAVSGLLNPAIGGRSVFPYQPPGVWEELATRTDSEKFTGQYYVQDHGPALYRRGMYTFWKRTAPPPELCALDAPDRETCTVRRPRTNTPLQSLVLMNSPTYVEAARKLAERMMEFASRPQRERIVLGFRLCTGRTPNDEEIGVLAKLFDEQLAAFKNDRESAERLLRVGEAQHDRRLDSAELASWTIVASAILNLDESISRN